MDYPTIEQAKTADREQVCRWWRFLPSPGMNAIGAKASLEEVNAAIDREADVMNELRERFRQVGGFTPEISRRIEWGDLTGLVKEA